VKGHYTPLTGDGPNFKQDHKRAMCLRAGMLTLSTVGLLGLLAGFSQAQSATETFTIAGVERQAIVYANSKPTGGAGAPVVFVFHGHGGNAQNAARRFRIHELWPEAVVIYMQGIPGVQGITDPEGTRNGWQKNPGELGDRDLKFFDAALELAQKKYKADPNRVYVLGHSNGGRFVNLLWNMRGDKIAALCSAAGPGGRLIASSKTEARIHHRRRERPARSVSDSAKQHRACAEGVADRCVESKGRRLDADRTGRIGHGACDLYSPWWTSVSK